MRKHFHSTVSIWHFSLLLSCFLLAAMILTGCNAPAPPNSNSAASNAAEQVVWQFTPQPPRIGASQWTVKLKDEVGKPVSGAKITLEGNMSHPGMQPVLASMREVAPGHYQAPLNFTMGGDWFVLIDAKLPDGRTLHQQCDVPNVRDK